MYEPRQPYRGSQYSLSRIPSQPNSQVNYNNNNNNNYSTPNYSSPFSTLSSFSRRTPLDINVGRRLYLREQKLIVTRQCLKENLPECYFMTHCVFLVMFSIIQFVCQIFDTVYRQSLHYVVPGFWSTFIYIICIVNVILLRKLFFICCC
jgi:hypothetical protein